MELKKQIKEDNNVALLDALPDTSTACSFLKSDTKS